MKPQITRQLPRTRARVVFELVAEVLSVHGILPTGRIRIRLQAVLRKRLNRERMRGIEVQVLLETVGEKEIVAHPPGGKRWQSPGIEVQLHAFPGAENHEAVIGGAEQRSHVAIARVVPCRAHVRPGPASPRVGIHR